MHGGVVMSLADYCGGTCAFLNLPEGASGTSTIESKTNFMRAGARGHADRHSRGHFTGRTLIVVETELRLDDGSLAAKVTQNQAFQFPPPSRGLGAAVDRHGGAARGRRVVRDEEADDLGDLPRGSTHFEWSASGWASRLAGVSITLGRIALARMPSSRYSASSAWTNASTAALRGDVAGGARRTAAARPARRRPRTRRRRARPAAASPRARAGRRAQVQPHHALELLAARSRARSGPEA